MKRAFLLILIFAVFTSTYARRIDRETARRVATTFVTQKSPRAFSNESQGEIVLADANRDARFSNFYIFSYETGFVIVAADDCVQPILAYSDEFPFNASALPSNIAVWLEGYENEIQAAVVQHLAATPEVQAEWSDLLAGRLPAPKSRGSVAPLVHTHWDQVAPYNNMCPVNSDGQAITGCVATAMAQVMRFWEFPYQGSGSHSYYHQSYGNISANFGNTVYDWDNMPDQVTASSPMVQQDAVATLMFHCGVSVEMDYSASSSGAYSEYVPSALIRYFSYSSDAKLVYKDNYSNSAWINLLKDELNSSRPLYYSGSGSGGHAFVCDGYDENNYFHFNWGWSGYCDGYYQIGALDPGPGGAGSGSGSYNYYNDIILNLHPDSDITAPSNLTATVNGTDVTLQWSSVSGATSYRVYRDNVKIATINATSYSDENLCYGPHTYYVKAVTQIGAMSDRSNIVDVDIVFPGPVPTNLTYTLEGNDVHLSWTAPDSENALLKYGELDNPTGYSYGYSGNNDTYWAQRYPKSTLAQYAGMAINQFSIYLSNGGSYMFYLYKGDETGATGELLHQESFSVTSSGVKTLTFSPIPLDYESDLWVVMYAGSDIAFPAAYCIFDGDNTDACYISKGINSWSTVSNVGNYSWMMETSVTDGTYTYNIYRNETLIADHTDATSYVDGNLSVGYYQYFVTTNYYGGESDASNRVDVIFGDISIFSISLGANPSEGGTVTGGGSYYEGLNCTVHAEPSHGYHFVNWTENGVEVSTDKDYTFTVSTDRALVANFEATVYSDGIVYVTQNGNGRMDGTSWDNATNNLQQAIDVATEEGLSKVWVAAGTYPGVVSIGDEFEESFDDGIPSNWSIIDADGDGEVWYQSSLAGDHGTSTNDSHSGFGHLMSESYCNAVGSILTPDNYIVSPLVTVVEGSTFSFWACAQDANWPAEHFGVAVSTTGNMNAEDFTTLDEWTIGRATDWTQYSCDLSAYAGQQVYIAIRHFNCSDMFILCVDDACLSYEEFGCFTMVEGVNVYGGFVGYEDPDYDLSQRDFETNTTVLNGRNQSRALYQPYAFNEQTIWDGFTIRNGFAEGDGGGAYLEANSKLQNCVFEYCQSEYGGAVFAEGTEFENCVFRNNSSLRSGGAVYMWNEGRFVNCLFTNNEATFGGAGSVDRTLFMNCVFSNNTASTSGGAVYVWNGQLVNCLLANNQGNYGGAVYADGRVSEYGYTGGEFINCDIVSNTAIYYGGGIYNSDEGGTFTNCIVWGNRSNSVPDQVYGNGTFTYCAVESGSSGTGNINLNAANDGTSTSYKYVRFVNPENGDFRLMQNSACVNAGQPDFTPTHLVDLEGNPRIYGDRIDIGCYEFFMAGFHFLGTTDANWNLAANWLNSSMPSADDEAFIDANCVLNEDVEIWKLTVSNGKSLSVPSGNTLTAETLVTTSPAQLVIEDGGQLVNENNDVKATVRKDINGYGTSENDWYMIASPVTDNTNVTNLTANVYNLFTFDGSEVLEWRTQHNNPAISHKTGYLYGNQEGTTLEFKGTLAGTTDATVLTLADGGEGMEFPGFNMIGNPYPCNAYITDSYLRMNALGNGFLPGTGAIAPCESVFVDADNDGQSVTFSKTPTRISFVSLTVFKNRGVADDRVIVRFDDSRDLVKFMFSEGNTKLYIPQDDKEFAVVSAAENSKQEKITEIPVNFKASEKGTYTISFDMEDVSSEYIHLIDNLTGADVDLLAAMADSKNPTDYTFEAKPSDYAARFKLVFKASNDDSADSASWFAYIRNGNLVIENIEGQATLQIIDVLGRVLSTEIVSGSYNKALNMSAGLYIINLNGKTQKIVVD